MEEKQNIWQKIKKVLPLRSIFKRCFASIFTFTVATAMLFMLILSVSAAMDTSFGLQGKITAANEEIIPSGNVTVIITDDNINCTSGNTVHSQTYTNALQNSIFNLEINTSLDYNKEYYLCAALNGGAWIGGPYRFRGGQGEVDLEDLANVLSETGRDFNVANVLYVNTTSGRVGIGTVSPATKFDVDGSIYSSNTTVGGGIFINDANGLSATYKIVRQDGYLEFGTPISGTSHFFFNTSNGNVGIGTSSPDDKLEVISDANSGIIQTRYTAVAADSPITKIRRARGTEETPTITSDADQIGIIQFQGHNGVSWQTAASINVEQDGDESGGRIPGKLLFKTTGNGVTADTRMVIDNGGNVGIGTVSPAKKLHVYYGDSGASAYGVDSIVLESNDREYLQFLTPDNKSAGILFGGPTSAIRAQIGHNKDDNILAFSFYPAATPGNFVFSSGNVGIGTSSPEAKLEIAGTPTLMLNATAGTSTDTQITLNSKGTGGNYISFKNNGTAGARISEINKKLNFLTNGYTQQMTIDSAGNVGIGTASPLINFVTGSGDFSSGGLHVKNAASAGDNASILIEGNGQADLWFGVTSAATNKGLFQIRALPDYMEFRSRGDTLAGGGVAIAFNGTTRDVFLSPNGGKVGIGTTNPGRILELKGNNPIIQFAHNVEDAGTMGIEFAHSEVGATNEKVAILSNATGSWGRADLHFVVDTVPDANSYTLGTDTKMFIDGTNGNVGIGTTSPSSELEVYDDFDVSTYMRATNPSNSLHGQAGINFRVKNSTAANDYNSPAIWAYNFNSTAWGGAKSLNINNANGPISFHNGLSNKNVVTIKDGKVGIGAISPISKLDILDGDLTLKSGVTATRTFTMYPAYNVDQGNNLRFTATSGLKTIQSSNNLALKTLAGNGGNIYLSPNEAAAVTVLNGGNVGIGTINPNYKLEVAGTTYFNGASRFNVGRGDVYLENNANDNADGAGITLRTSLNPTNGGIFAIRSSGEAARFWVGQSFTSTGTNDFYVGSSDSIVANDTSLYSTKIAKSGDSYFNGGNVGIGTTTPNTKLFVQGTMAVTDQAEFTGGVYVEQGLNVGDGNVGIGTTTPGEKLSVNGNINATGTITGGTGIDIAEAIHSTEDVEPGDVVVIDTEATEKVKLSSEPYDTTVAGIISTNPGFKLSQGGGEYLALAGRVPVKVTTQNGPIQAGDLLTTSSISGHAMRCDDKIKCIGAIVGKALENFDGDKGKIMVLVTLQ